MPLLLEIGGRTKFKPMCRLLILTYLQVMVFKCCFGMELADKINMLHQEAINGNDTAVRILLDDHVEPDARLTEGGVTAFYRAAAAGHRKIMHTLILAQAQINVNVTDPLMDLDGAPYDLLKYAIRSGDERAVENLLAVGANLNSTSLNWRYTPLHDAVEKCKFNITRILLEKKANPNADSVYGPPLSIAARQGDINMIHILMDNGADINGKGSTKPPLIESIIAGRQDISIKLIDLGANLSALSESGDNPIHIAARSGLNRIIKYLIKKGLVNQRNKAGRTPLHLAQYVDTAQILLKGGALIDAVTPMGETPLHNATFHDNYGLAELLVKKGARLDLLSNETYGMKDPFKEHKQLIRLLFKSNGKHNANSTKGFTALAIAIWKRNERLVSLLINEKSPLNVEWLEWPPLHMAAYCGDVNTIKQLVKAGADLKVRDIIGWTPLHKAVLKGTTEGVDCLARLGAQVDANDLYGRTPLHLAAEYGRLYVAKLLLSFGANANMEDKAGFNALAWAVAGGHPYFLRLMMDKVSDMESTKRYGYLRSSAKRDIEIIVNLTLEYKKYMYHFDERSLRDFVNNEIQDIHFNITDIERKLNEYTGDKDLPHDFNHILTIIKTAFQDGRKNHIEMVAVITNKTSDLDAQDSILGWSVLHWAAAAGDTDVVKYLVEKGSFINTENKLKQTPMFLARRWGHKDLYQYFRQSGAVW